LFIYISCINKTEKVISEETKLRRNDFLSLNISQAVEYLEEEFPATDERDEIVQFIRASQRGIIKRFSKTNGDEGIVD